MRYLLIILMLTVGVFAYNSTWSNNTQECMENCFDRLIYSKKLSRYGVESCMDKCERREYKRYDRDHGYKNKFHLNKNTNEVNISIKDGYVVTKGEMQYLNKKTYNVKKGETNKYYLTSYGGYKKLVLITLTNNNEIHLKVDGSHKTYKFKDNSKWFRGEDINIDGIYYNGKYRIFELVLKIEY